MIVVDRIEGSMAVVEIDGRTLDVPLTELPEGVKEGDRLAFTLLGPADTRAAEDRLARLKAGTPQGPGDFEL
jgi:hypothetical protein